ncbi:MAG: thioredoxin-like domain-containing protein [Thainema sp.]
MPPHVRAPQFPRDLTWLNTPNSLSLRDLRGTVVLLDFWTYGCINCLHVLPDLAWLEQKYAEQLVVIGVHTPKFAHEQSEAAVQQAIQRYDIQHPVINDCDCTLWNQYAVRAWPTLVVIDPNGYIALQVSGEGHLERINTVIAKLLGQEPESMPVLASALPQKTPPSNLHTKGQNLELSFPGEIWVDELCDRMFIADTGHHRIAISTLDGKLQATIGTEQSGWQDGDFATARFNMPQGLTFDAVQQRLYVADTGNHLIRCIDLEQEQVHTLAGTGRQSRVIYPHGGRATEVDLNSPWGLALVYPHLYMAMAGSHQIWVLNLVTNQISTLIGTGAEACVDGSPAIAAFAQPSGLCIDQCTDVCTDRPNLYVADCESSSIRQVNLATTRVQTLCGSGGLFDFGDRDGVGDQARLQHCLGVCAIGNTLWIADTYNHVIKQLNLNTRKCVTRWGTGQPGYRDGNGMCDRNSPQNSPQNCSQPALFNEPTALSATSTHLYVADTNNHAIRRINLSNNHVSTLIL